MYLFKYLSKCGNKNLAFKLFKSIVLTLLFKVLFKLPEFFNTSKSTSFFFDKPLARVTITLSIPPILKLFKTKQITEEDYQEAKRLITSAKEQYVQASQELIDVASRHEEITSDFVNEYNGLIESYKKTFDIQTGEIDLLLTHISVLKDLLCKLVSSNPELASNGYATEIIKICDETNLFEIKNNLMLAYEKDKEGENNE